LAGQSPIVSEIDVELYQTAEFDLSPYDHHGHGAGVCYSSYRRPILNMRPKARMSSMGVTWQFPADLSIILRRALFSIRGAATKSQRMGETTVNKKGWKHSLHEPATVSSVAENGGLLLSSRWDDTVANRT
jgi:hypothetical protein